MTHYYIYLLKYHPVYVDALFVLSGVLLVSKVDDPILGGALLCSMLDLILSRLGYSPVLDEGFFCHV